MTQTFFISGLLPGANDFMGKKSRWAYTAIKKEWGEAIGLYILLAKIQPMNRVSISFTWWERNRKRDPDNIMVAQKFILDALVTRQILTNDGWNAIASLHHTFYEDKRHPGVHVVLQSVGD